MRGRAPALLVAAALVWSVAACSGSGSGEESSATTFPVVEIPPTTTTNRPTSSSTYRAQLDELIEQAMAVAATPGALVSVSVPGHVNWTRGFGVADLATGAPMEPGMFFRIGDTTSMFTCIVMLKLAQDEYLSIDDPISMYLEGVPNESVTLGQLCQNVSGIQDYWANPNFYQQVAANPTRTWDPLQLVSYAGSSSMFRPGTAWYQSDTNAVLVGFAIETVTEKSLSENIIEWIINPMRLRNTFYPAANDVRLPEPSPRGYWQPDAEDPLEDYTELSPSVGAGAGAIVSNADDLARFVASVGQDLHVGRELTSVMRRTVQMSPDGPEWLRYGMGFVEMGPLIGHGGNMSGFSSGVVFDRGTGATVVVMFNNSTGSSDYPLFLAAALMAAALPDAARLPFTVDEVMAFVAAPVPG